MSRVDELRAKFHELAAATRAALRELSIAEHAERNDPMMLDVEIDE